MYIRKVFTPEFWTEIEAAQFCKKYGLYQYLTYRGYKNFDFEILEQPYLQANIHFQTFRISKSKLELELKKYYRL